MWIAPAVGSAQALAKRLPAEERSAEAFAPQGAFALRQTPSVLLWAGDSEGGAPFVEADPSHPDQLVGFDVEI
ncbi:MAG TPA: hypothetical protein VG222_03695, partial [Vicinamibacterales bacterium]|nr:hypothetical protein [Vicinamibacterales bacterium]